MRVLITGATGFVGAWTAEAVDHHGHQVRLLARDPARAVAVAAELGFDGSDIVRGDMTDAESVRAALTGCDAVIHAAAVVALDPAAADRTIRATVVGAENVLGQAVAAGLDPVVSVSSAVALWRPRCPLLHPDLPPGGGADAYGVAKARVERYARGLQRDGAPVVITYPSSVLGPAVAGRFGESGDAVGAFLRSGIPGRGAAFSVADVRDVAQAHALLLEPGRGPRRYVIAGHHVTGAELAAELSTVSGRRVRHHRLPDAALVAAGTLADRFRDRLPPSLRKLGAAGVRYLVDSPPADNSAAERDLGLTFRPVRQTLEDLLADRKRLRATRS
ncbi:NAD-dependent epimerase/dehydratase family protein [Nocardia sp. NPDC057353]|uniref:NAD-dependent epimerase/dehydratase family protein n=1 Tax=Nocardia sp. NPDC057353 TaxID=3346104 RepID=UPI00363C87E9